MNIDWNKEEGFRLEIPYGGWMVFCAGTSMLITAVRWW